MRYSEKLRWGIILTGLVLLVLSCAKDETKVELTTTSTFPLTTDSRWVYEGMMYSVPYHDSSLADTAYVEVQRHIIGPDSLDQIADLTVCDDTVVIVGPAEGQIDTSIHRQWLKLEDSKLKQFAYNEFNIGDTVVPNIFGFPHNLLDFPLSNGKGWVVFSNILTLQNKTVVGKDYIELPFGWQYCDVVLGITLGDVPEDTLELSYEWITNDGLMRLELNLGPREIRDNFGNVLDTATVYQTWNLTGIDIKP